MGYQLMEDIYDGGPKYDLSAVKRVVKAIKRPQLMADMVEAMGLDLAVQRSMPKMPSRKMN